ncbi:hypothetical protein GSI_01920 [Ganoderma sinense ZZ0214-1]|uniref:Uncharacterized protein n=1 Tax=Ganoderma sinense ZZ0214-1 TaxID=1077348 RepID=A0A2G8SRQ7_9APHY|nr:hypothetical protein GSI_01920 [Ganoderma sinense ZZ0214-1]
MLSGSTRSASRNGRTDSNITVASISSFIERRSVAGSRNSWRMRNSISGEKNDNRTSTRSAFRFADSVRSLSELATVPRWTSAVPARCQTRATRPPCISRLLDMLSQKCVRDLA